MSVPVSGRDGLGWTRTKELDSCNPQLLRMDEAIQIADQTALKASSLRSERQAKQHGKKPALSTIHTCCVPKNTCKTGQSLPSLFVFEAFVLLNKTSRSLPVELTLPLKRGRLSPACLRGTALGTSCFSRLADLEQTQPRELCALETTPITTAQLSNPRPGPVYLLLYTCL